MAYVRTTRATAVGILLALTLGACGFTGLNDIPMPIGKGSSEDAVEVTVMLENSTNLVPNSEVRYDEVIVGSVRRIEFDDWRAKLTIGLEKDARVPADVTAKVAQKSLMGAEYLELSSASDTDLLLADGSRLGLDRTGRYPETEEVLAAAALLLNGGGLPRLRTITHELNLALEGRSDDVRSLVTQVEKFTQSLDRQRDNIVKALEALDRFSTTVAGQEAEIDRALERLPRGVQALVHERERLVAALDSLEDFSRVADRVFNENEDGLVANLANLRPVTKQLADHADDLVQTIDAITFPFPIKSINKSLFGDYINFFALVDLDLSQTAINWTNGTSLEELVGQVLGVPATATQGGDPLADAPGIRAGSADPAPDDGAGDAGATDRNGERPTDPVPPSSSLDAALGGLMGGGS